MVLCAALPVVQQAEQLVLGDREADFGYRLLQQDGAIPFAILVFGRGKVATRRGSEMRVMHC